MLNGRSAKDPAFLIRQSLCQQFVVEAMPNLQARAAQTGRVDEKIVSQLKT